MDAAEDYFIFVYVAFTLVYMLNKYIALLTSNSASLFIFQCLLLNSLKGHTHLTPTLLVILVIPQGERAVAAVYV